MSDVMGHDEFGWRVGRKLGRTLYEDGELVGLVDTCEQAARIVQAMNERSRAQARAVIDQRECGMTHSTGCACHEARRDAELAEAVARADAAESDLFRVGSQAAAMRAALEAVFVWDRLVIDGEIESDEGLPVPVLAKLQNALAPDAGKGWLSPEHAEDRKCWAHGEGQEHAIADVNAGRIDDLIQPRLRALVDRVVEACAAVADECVSAALDNRPWDACRAAIARDIRALDRAALLGGGK